MKNVFFHLPDGRRRFTSIGIAYLDPFGDWQENIYLYEKQCYPPEPSCYGGSSRGQPVGRMCYGCLLRVAIYTPAIHGFAYPMSLYVTKASDLHKRNRNKPYIFMAKGI